MATIAVCVARWLNYSETFIYRQTTAMKEFGTIVLSVGKPSLGQFPHPRVRSLRFPHPGLLCGRRGPPGGLPRPDLVLLARMARREKVSLLHAHYGTVGCYFLDVARRLKCPLVVTFHGRDASRNLRYPGCLARYREMWREAGFVVAVSERIKARLVAAGCPEEKTHCIHTGVPVDDLPYRAPVPAARGGPVHILCVGRLTETKGHPFLLRAVAMLRDGGCDARLRLIGDGPLLSPLRRLAAELRISQGVSFEGAQPQDYVRQALRQAHLFGLAAVTAADGHEEGIPVVLMEAMASGVPVVSTWHGGIPELVEDGVSGLLAPPGDPAALAERLSKVLDEPGLAQRLARAARQRVEAHFDTASETAHLERLYARLLGGA